MLRYLDTFVKRDGAWLFAERRLYVDWLEDRALLNESVQVMVVARPSPAQGTLSKKR